MNGFLMSLEKYVDNKYKLIAFDIDGTILNHEHKVCERLKKIVARLKQKGYLFTIVSARFPPSVLKIAKDLGLADNDPVIGLNGSFITNGSHEVLYSKDFTADTINQYLKEIGDSIAINYYHGFNWLVTHNNGYTNKELLALGGGFEYIIGNLATVNKITLMGENLTLINIQRLLSSANENLIVAFSHPNYLEITTNDISKFTGLKAYANKFNIQTDAIIAFGDGENDIPMLSNVGLGVAMDNAATHVKKVAHDIAPHHLEEGVAIYLENLVINGVL